MNTNEVPGFKPLSSITRTENSKTHLLGIETPTKTEVPAQSKNYIQQVAEQEGLHSCLPTSLLNGLIHLGAITSAEALDIQNSFKNQNNDLFTQRKFGDRTLTVFAVPTGILLERLKARLNKEFAFQVIGVRGLTASEVEQLFQEKLAQGKVVVGGDENHAVLITGYNKDNTAFTIRDPYFPHQSSEKNSLDFANAILIGEPWVTVLEKSTLTVP